MNDGQNFPSCFNLNEFHGTNVVQANLPFLAELATALNAAISEGQSRVNVPPMTLTMTPEQAGELSRALSGQNLSKCLGAFVCRLKDQVRKQTEHDETVGRISHVSNRNSEAA